MRRAFILFAAILITVSGMGQFTNVTVGSAANDGTGDPLRLSFQKLNFADNWLKTNLTTVSNLIGAGTAVNKMNTNEGTSFGQTLVSPITNLSLTASRFLYLDSAKRQTNAASLPNEIWAYATGTAGIAGDGLSDSAALTAALAAVDDVVFTKGEWEITSSVSIAATKRLIFEEGAYLKIAAGVTVTISGDIVAGPVKIFQFVSTGAVLFPKLAGAVAQSRVRDINVLWYAIGNGNGSHDQTLFEKVVSSVESGASARIYFPAGVYNITNTLRVLSGMQFEGASGNHAATQINFRPVGHNLPAFGVETGAQDFGFKNLVIAGPSDNTWTNLSAIQITNSTTRGLIDGNRFFSFNGAGIRAQGANLELVVRDNYFIGIINSASTGNNLTPAVAFDSTNTLGACEFKGNRINQCDMGVWVRGNPSDATAGFNSFTMVGGTIQNSGHDGPTGSGAVMFENGTGVTIVGTHFEANRATAGAYFKNVSSVNWSGGIMAADYVGVIYTTNGVVFDNVNTAMLSGFRFNNTGNKFIIVTNSPALPTRVEVVGCKFDLAGSVPLMTDAQILSRVSHPHVVIHNAIYRGTGAAEANVQSFIGGLRTRLDGDAFNALEIKVSGTNAAGWNKVVSVPDADTAAANKIIGVNSGATAYEHKSVTGSGSVVLATSPTITTPTIADFTNANHDHLDADDGGLLDAAAINSGTFALARISALIDTSAELISIVGDETGTGALVFGTSPTLTTPNIGAATATSVNGTTIPTSKTLVVTTDKISVLAATSSAELAGVLSDETGSGLAVFGTSPTITTPTVSGAIAFPDNTRQTFNPGADAAGINVGSHAGDPGTPSNGDLWYDSVAGELTARIAGANVALGAGGGGVSDGDKSDITVSGSGATWTIDNDVVSNAKAANMAEATIKARVSSGTGDPEDATFSQIDPLTSLGDWLIHDGSNSVRGYAAKYWRFTDEFLFGSTSGIAAPWDSGGTGSHSQGSGESGHPGIYNQTASTSTTGAQRAHLGVSSIRLGGGAFWFECVVLIPDLSDATDEYDFRIGLGDTLGARHSDGVYFEYDRNNNANWVGACNKGGAGNISTVDTGSAVGEDTWVRLGFIVNADATSVQFYVNGAAAGAAVTANIPNTDSNLCGAYISIAGSAGTSAANRTARIDYVDFGQILTTPR